MSTAHQATYPSRIDPSWTHVRTRQPPLFMMPHQWTPPIVPPNPEMTSHCDRIQGGWRKWGADHPDWYARRPEATHPDWFTRRVNTIRHGDLDELHWAWESTSKPTQMGMYGRSRDSRRPWQRGNYVAIPQDVYGQVEVPRWGIYHPQNYERPARVQTLPPLHLDQKHL